MHQQNHTTRFAVIVAVLILALWAIFPQPQKLFDSKLRFWEKTNLRPGIDMVGGTSLTYEIRAAAGSVAASDLAVRTMEALKKRDIGTLIHYPVPVHRQQAYADLGYPPGSLPVTEQIVSEIVSLPMYVGLTPAEAQTVAAAVNQIAEEFASC